uniref:Uncharacterized protein n=1 Tax=Arundo donax TaxID=35708 RepID=A0A0A9DHT8_ARUDO
MFLCLLPLSQQVPHVLLSKRFCLKICNVHVTELLTNRPQKKVKRKTERNIRYTTRSAVR